MSFIFLRNRVTGGAAFSPASLFASGEEGAWYEPSTTTAFRSTTNLTPCDYGQSAGFLLDLSKGAGYSGGSFTGLGSELVTNGTFDSDVTGWTVRTPANLSVSWSSGELSATPSATFSNGFYQDITTETDKTYHLEFSTSDSRVAATVYDGAGFATIIVSGGAGVTSLVFVAESTTSRLYISTPSASGFTYTIDNISVRELPGNHATQATEAARPILARVPEGGRRNLLERTEEFDGAVWVKSNTIVSANAGTDPDGGSTADKLVANTNDAQHRLDYTGTGVGGTTYTLSVYAKADGYNFIHLRTGNGLYGTVDLTDGSTSAASGATVTATSVGSGWYRCTCSQVLTTTGAMTSRINVGNQSILSNYTFAGDGTSGILIWGAQLEEASSATAYQKVVDQYDITEAGVTSLEYLAFDGANDSFVISGSQAWYDQYIGSIVIAASTDSTADQDVVSNRGADTAGVRGKYAFNIRNSGVNWTYDNIVAGSGAATSTASPINTPYVFYGSGDGTNVSSSINSGSVTTATDSYTARGLDAYIGQTGNSGTYFSGRIYGIVLTNDVLTAQEISDTEAYLASKSGVTLP